MIRVLLHQVSLRRFSVCTSVLGLALGVFAGEQPAPAQSSAAASTPLPAVPPVTAKQDMVVSIHHDATDAGVEILRAGGNAVDAAVAVGFALAVVLPAAGNIGGGGFMLVRPGTNQPMGHTRDGGQAHFLDFREKAPAAASRDMYLDAEGKVIPKMSTVGAKASGVPGTVAGLVYAESHFGKLSLARVMQPAIRLAGEGYVLTAEEASTLHSDRLQTTPVSRRIFQRDGDFYKAGETFKQPELARTLEHIATNPDDFYRGVMAQQIDAFEKANGGLITAADLAAYEVKDREPLVGHYRGLEVITSPPPSSGGVALLETLNMLSGYDLHAVGADRSPAQIHLITEAFRRAYMDRAQYLGDPDYTQIPIAQMEAQGYADAWRRTIDPVKPTPSKELVRPAGFLPPPPVIPARPAESHQTTHFSVVDKDGNAVSMTYTLNFGFGSGVTVEPLGFLLNDEMDDFASKMGVPNGFGLIQGPANAIAPGTSPSELDDADHCGGAVSVPAHAAAEAKRWRGNADGAWAGVPHWQAAAGAWLAGRRDHHHDGSERSDLDGRQRAEHPGGCGCAALPSPIPAGCPGV